MPIETGHDVLRWDVLGHHSASSDITPWPDRHTTDHPGTETNYRVGGDNRRGLVNAPPAQVRSRIFVHQVAHNRGAVTDNRCVADESGNTGILPDLDPIADIRTVNDAGPVPEPTAVADPSTILDHAVDTESGALVDNDMVEDQAAIAHHHRIANRAFTTLSRPNAGFFRIPEHAVLAHNRCLAEADRRIQALKVHAITADCSTSQSVVTEIASSSRSRESKP